MYRLQTKRVYPGDEEIEHGFAPITPIKHWLKYLNRIIPSGSVDAVSHHRSNIGHRLQLLEFQCGLLLFDWETKTQSRGKTSELHESVSRMMIHQYAVLCASILEGIGSDLTRRRKSEANSPIEPLSSIPMETWMHALLDHSLGGEGRFPIARDERLETLRQLVKWRDRIFLNHLEEADNPLHFEEFTYEDCFIPTYTTFNNLLTGLNSKWPTETCLNEFGKMSVLGQWQRKQPAE